MENRTHDLTSFLTSVVSNISPTNPFNASFAPTSPGPLHLPGPNDDYTSNSHQSKETENLTLDFTEEIPVEFLDLLSKHDSAGLPPQSTQYFDEFSNLDHNSSAQSELSVQEDHNFPLSENDTSNESFIVNQLIEEFRERSIALSDSQAHDSSESWFHCFGTFVEKKMSKDHDPSACQIKFDGASCWPETPSGALSTISCFAEFNRVPYDTSQNATLQCYQNGTWASQANYDRCTQLVAIMPEPPPADNTKLLIYYVGYSISLVAVVLALAIFAALKDLRCLRNTIHANLLATYLLHNMLWLVSASLLLHVHDTVGCMFLVLLEYAQFTNFMWMFVEGLYLYVLVVKTFSVENITLKVYLIIGWVVGVPIILAWLLARIYAPPSMSEMQDPSMIAGGGCFLHHESTLNWVVRIPTLAVLATNILFLFRIMWVLITKLRSAKTVETQRYRKAAKALLVLIPLLGLNYVLLIALPHSLEHLHPCLLSTQGLWVALFYCFLNSEVQNSIRHHIARWRAERGLIDNRVPDRLGGRDVSPRGRNRFTRYGRRFLAGMGRKRESVCSEVTTTTTFITNGSNQPHQNFKQQKTCKQLLPLYQVPPSNSQILQRHFRHSHPNLTQTSCFVTNRCDPPADKPAASPENMPDNSLPIYRPVSRNSNHSPCPFDPPNIPLITPVLTPTSPPGAANEETNDFISRETQATAAPTTPSAAAIAIPDIAFQSAPPESKVTVDLDIARCHQPADASRAVASTTVQISSVISSACSTTLQIADPTNIAPKVKVDPPKRVVSCEHDGPIVCNLSAPLLESQEETSTQ